MMTPWTGVLAIVATNNPADSSDTAAAMTKRAFTRVGSQRRPSPPPGLSPGVNAGAPMPRYSKWEGVSGMEQERSAGASSKQKILVVEDDAKIARVLQLELEHEGFEVEWCGDGA